MLFQKVLLPLPACDRSSHLQCGFHLLFEALRHSSCRLTQLNLSKASISVSDAMCLGESLRKNRVLVSLRLEGLSSLKEVLPVCLSLAENKALQLLDVSSNHVVVNDSAFQLICRALGRNNSLQSLRMCGWTFCLEEEDTLKTLSDAVQTSRLRELALSSSLIRIPFQDKRSKLSSALLGPVMLDDLVALMSQEGFDQVRSDWLAFLKLDNCRLELNSKLTLRGAHLVFFTSGFQRLSEVNLALDSAAQQTAEPLRDKASLAFFQSLSQSCSQLRTLVLNHWRFHWTKPDKVLKVFFFKFNLIKLNFQSNFIILGDRQEPEKHVAEQPQFGRTDCPVGATVRDGNLVGPRPRFDFEQFDSFVAQQLEAERRGRDRFGQNHSRQTGQQRPGALTQERALADGPAAGQSGRRVWKGLGVPREQRLRLQIQEDGPSPEFPQQDDVDHVLLERMKKNCRLQFCVILKL